MIDLFASNLNKKMVIFCTWDHHPLAYAVDAFSVAWNHMFAHAFPPICLIPKVLEYMTQGHCQLILIAPPWLRTHWYTDLLQLCIAIPIKLPVTHNLLSHQNRVNMDIIRQSACLVLYPITVYSYGFLFNCTTVGQASDSMTALS